VDVSKTCSEEAASSAIVPDEGTPIPDWIEARPHRFGFPMTRALAGCTNCYLSLAQCRMVESRAKVTTPPPPTLSLHTLTPEGRLEVGGGVLVVTAVAILAE
jgi:hypothetical protein